MSSILRLIYLGDIIGKPGQAMVDKWVPQLREKYKADALFLNGENAANNGKGITPKIAQGFFEKGATAISTGNHIWAHKEVYSYLDETPAIIRPANFPPGVPGKGFCLLNIAGHTVALVNVQGRAFMADQVDDPFRTLESLLTFLSHKTKTILVDIHAEATAEKACLAHFLDSKVSVVVGTHTHVQTADERILPGGTAFITDLGSCCALNSSIGMRLDQMIGRARMQMPIRGEIENKGPFVMTGIFVTVDTTTGKALTIERIKVIDDQLVVGPE